MFHTSKHTETSYVTRVKYYTKLCFLKLMIITLLIYHGNYN